MVLHLRNTLGLLAFLFFSSQVNAGTYWEVGVYYGTTGTEAANAQCDAVANTTCQNICHVRVISSTREYHYKQKSTDSQAAIDSNCNDGGYNYYIANLINGTCPASLPYEHSDGTCQSYEEVQCPAGTTNIGTSENPDCAEICPAGFKTKHVVSFENIKSSTYDGLGCEVTLSPGTTECFFETMLCNVYYENTGVYDDSQPDGTESESTPNVPQGSSDETVQESQTEPTVTNNPDGSTTTEQTYTKEFTPKVDTSIEVLGDNIYKKDETGAYTDIISQKTINTFSDGSKTVTEEITYTYNSPESITTEKNLTTGQTSTSGVTGTSSSKTVTKTKTYNQTGIQTGETTTTSGDSSVSDGINTSTVGGDGTGEGEGGAGFCEYATPVCDFIDWFSEEDDFPESGELPVQEMGANDITTGWTSGLPDTGNCPVPYQMTLLGVQFELDYSLFCELAVQARPLVIAGAYLAAALILVGGLRR